MVKYCHAWTYWGGRRCLGINLLVGTGAQILTRALILLLCYLRYLCYLQYIRCQHEGVVQAAFSEGAQAVV